jgi:hypothetical protein
MWRKKQHQPIIRLHLERRRQPWSCFDPFFYSIKGQLCRSERVPKKSPKLGFLNIIGGWRNEIRGLETRSKSYMQWFQTSLHYDNRFWLSLSGVRLIYKTERDNIGQDKTVLEREFFIFENKMDNFVFFYSCTVDIKLSCGLVRDKNFCFCPVPYYLFCLVPLPVSKSNMIQPKLSNPVLHFLAYQTHPMSVCDHVRAFHITLYQYICTSFRFFSSFDTAVSYFSNVNVISFTSWFTHTLLSDFIVIHSPYAFFTLTYSYKPSQ